MGFLKASTFSTDCSAMLAQKNNVDPSKQEITVEMSNKFIVLFSSFERFWVFVCFFTNINKAIQKHFSSKKPTENNM